MTDAHPGATEKITQLVVERVARATAESRGPRATDSRPRLPGLHARRAQALQAILRLSREARARVGGRGIDQDEQRGAVAALLELARHLEGDHAAGAQAGKSIRPRVCRRRISAT